MNNSLSNLSDGPTLSTESVQKKRKTNTLHAAATYPPILQTKPGFQQNNLMKTLPPENITNMCIFEPNTTLNAPNGTDHTKFNMQKITPTNPALAQYSQTATSMGSSQPLVSSVGPSNSSVNNRMGPTNKKTHKTNQKKSADVESTKINSQNLKSSNDSQGDIQNPDANLLVMPLPKKENADLLISGKSEINSMGKDCLL